MSSIGRFVAAFALIAAALAIPGHARVLENGHFVFDPATGFAANGYDPVAYFVDGTIREGDPDYEARWGEVTWRFANEGNRDAFVRDPLVYAPSFGGRCPVALARGYPAEGNPRLWSVYEERLYFFYSQEHMQAFTEDPDQILAEARQSWNKQFPY
ncbi:YHS domain-containing (seleno)protein [Microbaculum sp. FT89]|uniref:YHS domain-containing (seleno)protein n=1 Tax=Microbaculum sp. FT89 TaxID=3447298 RepID=UPI003F5305DD